MFFKISSIFFRTRKLQENFTVKALFKLLRETFSKFLNEKENYVREEIRILFQEFFTLNQLLFSLILTQRY